MTVTPAVPLDLAESLVAAAAARTVIHFDICTVYSEGPEYGCSCGVPSLLAALVDALGLRDLEAAMFARGDLYAPARQA